MDKKIAEQKAWYKIIGNKIICSGCNQTQHGIVNRDPACFEFTPIKRGPKSFVSVRCTSCGHEGDYNPTDEEVYQYEYIARANIDLQILEEHGEDPPITNVEVDSVFRREGWKNDVPEATLDNWKARCEKNYVIEV
jgi:hypothetical protein